MAGFKQPVYEILAFNLQSLSVYDSRYELLKQSTTVRLLMTP
jgi:hypothetical protein